jgi:hypothetical protein
LETQNAILWKFIPENKRSLLASALNNHPPDEVEEEEGGPLDSSPTQQQ